MLITYSRVVNAHILAPSIDRTLNDIITGQVSNVACGSSMVDGLLVRRFGEVDGIMLVNTARLVMSVKSWLFMRQGVLRVLFGC